MMNQQPPITYRYATVVQLTDHDTRNDKDPGSVMIIAGKHEDGYTYTILDDEKEGFSDIQCETLGVIGPSDQRMSGSEIRSMAANTDKAVRLAKEAEKPATNA